MTDQLTLSAVLEQIDEEANNSDSACVGDLVAHFQSRGFGPLIMFPALIAGLPTGAIPGVPSLCGLCIALISIQWVFGKKYPWIPDKLAKIDLDSEKIHKIVKKTAPWTQRIDKVIKPRFKGLTTDAAQRIIAFITTLLGLSMIPLELVPLGAGLPAWVLVIIAVGFSGRDGLLILLAMVVAIGGGLWLWL